MKTIFILIIYLSTILANYECDNNYETVSYQHSDGLINMEKYTKYTSLTETSPLKINLEKVLCYGKCNTLKVNSNIFTVYFNNTLNFNPNAVISNGQYWDLKPKLYCSSINIDGVDYIKNNSCKIEIFPFKKKTFLGNCCYFTPLLLIIGSTYIYSKIQFININSHQKKNLKKRSENDEMNMIDRIEIFFTSIIIIGILGSIGIFDKNIPTRLM